MDLKAKTDRSWGGDRGSWTIALALACLCPLGCSDDADTGSDPRACIAHATPAPDALATPAASFESDVAPVLAKSCAFASCHGSRGAGNRGVFLGALADAPAVKSGLTAPSQALPSMPYVTPGDPDNSFLMHKLDGDLCVLEASCVDGSCGKTMPAGNTLLPEASRDAIRRWIAQGAR